MGGQKKITDKTIWHSDTCNTFDTNIEIFTLPQIPGSMHKNIIGFCLHRRDPFIITFSMLNSVSCESHWLYDCYQIAAQIAGCLKPFSVVLCPGWNNGDIGKTYQTLVFCCRSCCLAAWKYVQHVTECTLLRTWRAKDFYCDTRIVALHIDCAIWEIGFLWNRCLHNHDDEDCEDKCWV